MSHSCGSSSCSSYSFTNTNHNNNSINWELPKKVQDYFTEVEIRALKARFQALVVAGGTSITAADIQRFLASKGNFMDLNTAKYYLADADKDNDGSITWQEFVQMMTELKAGKRTVHLAGLFFPAEEDARLDVLFRNNRQWVAKMKEQDGSYFDKLKHGQQPQYLFIGCADSRVPAQELMGMKAGEMFVHRNIANMVVKSDLNLLSVIAYAVNVLKVHDIIVCGHYDCGGVKAAATQKDHGLVEHWICNIRDVARLHQEELSSITDPEKHHRRMVELNVQEQCLNLASNPIIQAAQAQNDGFPRVHGLVYDVAEGLLQRLSVDIHSHIASHHHIYSTGASGGPVHSHWESRILRCEKELGIH
eukprot:EG_transcript_11777